MSTKWLFCVLLICFVSAKRDANSRLKLCCARQTTADQTCKRRYCDFNVLSQENALLFFNLCSPKGNTLKLMWSCVTSETDHLECCKNKKVPKECMDYCSYRKAPNDYLKHLFCLTAFNPIRDCFRSHLEHHPNIFGEF
ncbi:Protein of unknown function DB domain containing protein [Aphelenchoides besseyi]|nr:Protein of unknown function DB domain containing protein [Aphelenchoides besseyi]KAI6194383.1 Protein of unknown function DB domain containing protein [Aphelenchoides besseyi]